VPVGGGAPLGADLGGATNRDLPDRAVPEIAAVQPEPGGLTADEVARRALAVNAPVKQKRAELAAAEEKINQTMWQFFPKITAQAAYTRLSPVSVNFGANLVAANSPGPLATGPCANGAGTCVVAQNPTPGVQNADQVNAVPFIIPAVVNNYSLVGRFSIPISDYILRISDAAASSKAGKESARFALRAEEARVDSQARSLYFNWLRARGSAEIAQKAVERTQARLQDARSSFTVGVISKADLLRIEALVANTETTLSRAKSLVELTTGQLAILMQDWHPNYKVGEAIPQPSSIPENTEPVDHLVAEAHARRLEVRAVDESARAYHRAASATRTGALPRVDATGDITYANPNPRYFPATQTWNTTWSVGVAATWTLGDAFIQSAAARELDANAEAAEARRIDLRAAIANEVLSSYLDLARARENYGQQGVALAAAEEAYRVTTDLFRAGRATGTDLIESENELLNAKLGEINARIDLTIAAISLRHATARDLPKSNAEAKN
jgi:outer membrane protein TolC